MTRAVPLVCLAAVGCDLAYPEVVVVNEIAEPIQLRHVSFNGCAWDGVLAFGDATAPGRCLPGEDRVHFQKLDTAAYCEAQADAVPRVGPTSAEPLWFNYQTVRSERVDYGDFRRFVLTLDGLEQDFSVPGPYGH